MYDKYSYILFIFYLYNKSNIANYLVCTISDYAILLTNLNDLYELFKNNLEDIISKEIQCNNKNKKLEKKIYDDKLGFKPDENMTQLDCFKKFLEKKLFQKKKKK